MTQKDLDKLLNYISMICRINDVKTDSLINARKFFVNISENNLLEEVSYPDEVYSPDRDTICFLWAKLYPDENNTDAGVKYLTCYISSSDRMRFNYESFQISTMGSVDFDNINDCKGFIYILKDLNGAHSE